MDAIKRFLCSIFHRRFHGVRAWGTIVRRGEKIPLMDIYCERCKKFPSVASPAVRGKSMRGAIEEGMKNG